MSDSPIHYSKSVLNPTEIRGVELAFAIAAYKANQEGRLDSAVNGMDSVNNMEPGIPKMMLTKKHQMSLIGDVICNYSTLERYASDVAKRHSQKSQSVPGVETKRRPTSIEKSLSKLSDFMEDLHSEHRKLRAEFLEPFLPSARIFAEKFDAAKSLHSDFAKLELEFQKKMPELKEAMNQLSDHYSLPTALTAAKQELELRKSLVFCFEDSANCLKEVDALKSELKTSFPGGFANYYPYPHPYSLDIDVKYIERRLDCLKEDCQRAETQVATLEAQVADDLAGEVLIEVANEVATEVATEVANEVANKAATSQANPVQAPVFQGVTPANRRTFMDRFSRIGRLSMLKPFNSGFGRTQQSLSTR
ncbi:MAG: hypothetical protein QE278_05400 [Limnobacter sp.]|nr:hypothetical protein [Limnobacter sp.]